MNFFKMFRRKKKRILIGGLNNDVISGFIDKIEDIVCILDKEYKIDYINKPEMAKQYKYLIELFEYKENKELYDNIINIVAEEGFYSDNVYVMKKKEKTAMYLAIYYIRSVDKYVLYIKDTDRYFKNENKLKEQLSRSNEELKNKELFVANLSHEIKTPINIIVAMIYFLKSTKLDEAQNEYLNRLEGASDLLIELVNNILNVTKGDNITNATNVKELFLLKDTIDKAYLIFKDDIEKKNIDWSIESNCDLDIEIYEDKTKLEQIFINLISNAVKYTDKGYIELEVYKVDETVDSYKIRFCIKDTGRGIKREDTIKIFKEFEQTSDPTIKEKEGFGLGLPLVKKIIENMGGKIWVESSYGLGTKFFFELSFLKNDNSLNKIKMEDMVVEEQEEIENSITNKVLIVDDNEIINQITEKVLSELNIQCDTVLDGMEAIRKVEEKGKNYYSIILMDIHMPEYNGYDISRIMKEELNVKTPIIALTATNITEKVIEENKNYITSYIQKPVKPEELKNIINNILNSKNNKIQKDKKRETILFIADKIKNWQIFENLNAIYNVICTLNVKDINIILKTKKLAAVLIDQKEENKIKEDIANNFSDNIKLFLNYEEKEDEQVNITISDINGYIRNVKEISEIEYVLKEVISRIKNDKDVKYTIEAYNNEISEIYRFLYDSLVNLTSIRSKETGSHLMRTQEYIKLMLREYERMFKTKEFEEIKTIENIGVAATLHDIGKVGIPDRILNKPDKLTDEEYEKIKEHVIIGHQLLENTKSDKISDDILEYAKEITLHHHEKYDGTGYPDNLKGEEINILSRAMAIIDTYDALVNKRVYKEALSYAEAEKYIISQSGIAFDPKLVNVFMNVKEKLKNINETYIEEN